jgi:hypothetical protein
MRQAQQSENGSDTTDQSGDFEMRHDPRQEEDDQAHESWKSELWSERINVNGILHLPQE